MTTSPGTFFHGTGDPWRTFGTEDFCTWREPGEPGVAIFQTRRPDFAKKLSKRAGCSLFRSDCGGGYLRIFSERMQAWQARRLLTRYRRAANKGFSDFADPQRRPKRSGRVVGAARRADASTRRAALESLHGRSRLFSGRTFSELQIQTAANDSKEEVATA